MLFKSKSIHVVTLEPRQSVLFTTNQLPLEERLMSNRIESRGEIFSTSPEEGRLNVIPTPERKTDNVARERISEREHPTGFKRIVATFMLILVPFGTASLAPLLIRVHPKISMLKVVWRNFAIASALLPFVWREYKRDPNRIWYKKEVLRNPLAVKKFLWSGLCHLIWLICVCYALQRTPLSHNVLLNCASDLMLYAWKIFKTEQGTLSTTKKKTLLIGILGICLIFLDFSSKPWGLVSFHQKSLGTIDGSLVIYYQWLEPQSW
eukprot:TRINITY_DN7077_c0_g1_i12.p1 TRINITY_DN7077_c0_g1~~TRINITY_DN7077_c0_g1_i12.p1  ORF type:complete len:264 (-),score=-4.54 TRINITY_DN7077_c0_g1_i12:338-1129(-)